MSDDEKGLEMGPEGVSFIPILSGKKLEACKAAMARGESSTCLHCRHGWFWAKLSRWLMKVNCSFSRLVARFGRQVTYLIRTGLPSPAGSLLINGFKTGSLAGHFIQGQYQC
jgi:hypothetical protein